MFEQLDSIRPDLEPMFERLRKADPETINRERARYPKCPEAYWQFLLERGFGALQQDGEPFYFEQALRSAETDYFLDRLIYENGAKGDILIFGSESMGTVYGFDSGDDWKLVEVDEFRIVTVLDLTFEEFVVGLVLCYPQIPVKRENERWVDGIGTHYTLFR
jgi:hypothetical protein